MKESTQNKMLAIAALILERITPNFISIIRRPKKANDINLFSDMVIKEKDFAVVMQGPIISKNNFTYETLKLYKEIFEGACLILSTWEGEDSKQIQKISDLGVEIILNKKPDFSGISNVNFQIVSTKEGVKYALKNGYKYCLKTRTDQRINHYNTYWYFRNIQEVFPLKKAGIQKSRLITISLNTFKYRLYGITDMLMFGNTLDMLIYWDVKLDKRKILEYSETMYAYSKLKYCEVYYSTSFFKKIGEDLKWTLEHSWKLIAEHFCVVDIHQIDLFWYKYNYYIEDRYRIYNKRHLKEEVEFTDWLYLYMNKASNINENIIHLPINSEINKQNIRK